MFRRILHWLWPPRPPPRPPPRKARPEKWDGTAAVTRTTALRLEWLSRETGAPPEKVVLTAVRCFGQLPSVNREHLAWQHLSGCRDCGVSLSKEVRGVLAGLRVRKGWLDAQLAAAALGWFSSLPVVYAVALVREEGE